jgi:hypothetical protein
MSIIDNEDGFQFTPDNLLENLHRLGPWSSYGLAVTALMYYFPDEYDENGYCHTRREIELMVKIGCKFWHDAIIKYHNEVGYVAPDGFNKSLVNEY